MPSYASLKWSFARSRLEFRERSGALLKIQYKLFNMLRRLVIAAASLWLKRYRREEPLDLADVSSVLIIPNEPIGDLLLTSTLWHILKARKPELRIGVMASPRNKSLLRNDAEVTHEYDIFTHNLLHRLREIFRARRDNWDVVITTGGFFKPVRYALMMRFVARDKVTASLHDSREERLHNIYSYCFKRAVHLPIIEQFQSLLERLFEIEIRDDERIPRYSPKQEVLVETGIRVRELRDRLGGESVVHLHLEAKRLSLEWELDNVRKFAERLTSVRGNVLLLLTASPLFLSRYPEYTNLGIERCMIFPTKSVEELAAIIPFVDLVITPDTAVVHFAALAHAPLIVLFEKETEWMPYRAQFTIFTSGAHIPVRFIPVEQVLAASLTLMNKRQVDSDPSIPTR